MELRHLRYFTAVAEQLNFSEASRRLRVAQPAISQTILDLEDELGVKLLLRTKRHVQLTVAGQLFAREAREILRRAGEAVRLAQRAARGEVGGFNLGFFGSAIAPILPELVQSYRRQFPEVELRLYELTPEQQLSAFDTGRIDLAFTRPLPPERTADFHQETIYIDNLVIALPANHPLAGQKRVRLKSVARESFVQFHRQGAPGLYDEVIATCRRAGFSPRVINEPDFMATVLTLVESGLGVSLVPGNVKNICRPQVAIRPISPPSARIPLCLVWRKSVANPALEAFIEIVRSKKAAIQALMGSRDSLRQPNLER
jgi:DNA-binding transcriptional LysR family regulator